MACAFEISDLRTMQMWRVGESKVKGTHLECFMLAPF